LTQFFSKAFRRNVAERFDNAEEMLRDWRECFKDVEEAGTEAHDDSALRALLAQATFDTQIHELGLGARATNALEYSDG
jgi:hypothetical protein